MAKVLSRGDNCLNLKHGQCAFAGGRCIDGRVIDGEVYRCPQWKSLAKRTAALVRWAKKHRSGERGRL